jgi:hypothetical protein
MAFLLTMADGEALHMREILSFFGGGLLLVTVGVIDDFIELSPLARFAAQIVAALLMIFGAGVVLTDLGGMTLSGRLLTMGVFAVPFTVFATLGVINALNMCDGLDGLSGSLSLVSLTGLFLAAWLWGDVADVILLPLLGSAVVGFLLFNLRLPVVSVPPSSWVMRQHVSRLRTHLVRGLAVPGRVAGDKPGGCFVVPDAADFRYRHDDVAPDTARQVAVLTGP